MQIEEVVGCLILSIYLANMGARGAVFSPTQTARADGVRHKAAYWQRAEDQSCVAQSWTKLLELWMHDTQKHHNI